MKVLKFLLSMILAMALVTACNTPPAETTAEESEDATEYAEDGDMTEDEAGADGMEAVSDGEEPVEAEGIDEVAGLEGEEYYTHEITGETVYTFLLDEEKPTFDGDMTEFLQNTIDYPKESREKGNEGTIIVDFVVGKDGYVKDAHVIKPHEDVLLNNEAIRVVNAMPQWNPAVKDGTPVAYKYVLPIHFKLLD
jgi:TonB family protein